MTPPSVDVSSTNRLRESQRSVNDVRRKHPEARSNIAATWILTAERGDEYSGRARRILLVMDATHRENRCLKLPQLGLYLRVEAELLHETCVENALDDGQDLVRTRMQMGDVEAAGLDEGHGTGDAELLEDGEVVNSGEEDGATRASGRLVAVKIEHGEITESVASEDGAVRVGQQLFEAVDDAGLGLES